MGWNNHIRKVDNEEYFRKHKELLIYYYKWASSWFCIKERHLDSMCCIMKVPKQTFATFTKKGVSCKYYVST